MLVLVRHAHAGNKAGWAGRDAERPLSPLGRQQAGHLVTALAGIELHTLLTCPTVRCRQTLAPIAADRGLRLEDRQILAPDAPIEELLTLLSTASFDNLALCTHGEVLDALAAYAVANGLAVSAPTADTAKGAAWLIDRRSTPPPARYIAPYPANPTITTGVDVGSAVARSPSLRSGTEHS